MYFNQNTSAEQPMIYFQGQNANFLATNGNSQIWPNYSLIVCQLWEGWDVKHWECMAN